MFVKIMFFLTLVLSEHAFSIDNDEMTDRLTDDGRNINNATVIFLFYLQCSIFFSLQLHN